MPRAWREGNPRFRRMHCLPSKALLFLSRRKRKNRSHAGIDWTPSDDYELAEEIFTSNSETSSNSRWMLKRRSTYLIGGRNPRRVCGGFVIGSYLSEPTETSIPSDYFDQMSLLTWKGWSGDLCFLLVPMIERG